MRTLIRTLAISTLLLAPSIAHAQVSIGVQIGQPPPPPPRYIVSRQPGPDYVWVDGYWFPEGRRYRWHDGYWTRVPYEGAYWVSPYYASGRYFPGRWEGRRGYVQHDHRWDRDRRRDERRGERRERDEHRDRDYRRDRR